MVTVASGVACAASFSPIAPSLNVPPPPPLPSFPGSLAPPSPGGEASPFAPSKPEGLEPEQPPIARTARGKRMDSDLCITSFMSSLWFKERGYRRREGQNESERRPD